MHGESELDFLSRRHRAALAALALGITACRAPLPNPDSSAAVEAETVHRETIVAGEAEFDAESEEKAARPFRIEDLALDTAVQPVGVGIDPTGESAWSDLDAMFRSPLWMPVAYPSDGRYPTPPGRAQRESIVMSFLISAALIASSPWTLQKWAK